MRINTRSQKVRQEVLVVLGVVAILTVGVMAFNAEQVEAPTEYVVHNGVVMPADMAAGIPKEEPKKPAAAPRETHVYATLSDISGVSGFRALLSQTGLSTLLAGGGPYTVFVPTNTALSYANTGTMSAAEKKRFVEYHIIKDRSVDISALRSGNVYAASGDQLNFAVVGDQKLERVNSSRIVDEYAAGNGIIYVIDAPLLPPAR